jgi:hypothetical protein
MINQYKNIDQIKSATQSVSAERIERKKLDLVERDLYNGYYLNTDIINSNKDSVIEMHVYVNDSWITGNHTVQNVRIPIRTKNTKRGSRQEYSKNINIDLAKEFESLKISAGSFRFALNFFKNLIGSYDEQIKSNPTHQEDFINTD